MRIFPIRISRSACFIVLESWFQMCLRQHLTLKHFIAVAESLSSLLEILLGNTNTSYFRSFRTLTFSFLQRYFCIFSTGCSGIIHSGETVFLRRVQNLVKHLRWSLCSWNFYGKSSTMDGWLSSEYASVIKSAEKVASIFCFLLTFQVRLSIVIRLSIIITFIR